MRAGEPSAEKSSIVESVEMNKAVVELVDGAL